MCVFLYVLHTTGLFEGECAVFRLGLAVGSGSGLGHKDDVCFSYFSFK